MFRAFDMWGDEVFVGDTVIVSRPTEGSSYLSYCKIQKINEKSVTIRRLNRDNSEYEQTERWGDAPVFTVKKNRYAENKDSCEKIVRHNASTIIP